MDEETKYLSELRCLIAKMEILNKKVVAFKAKRNPFGGAFRLDDSMSEERKIYLSELRCLNNDGKRIYYELTCLEERIMGKCDYLHDSITTLKGAVSYLFEDLGKQLTSTL